jgi:hypothetical protein
MYDLLLQEHDRRLAEDLAKLGSRPAWWRLRSRGQWDRSAARLARWHKRDLAMVLAAEPEQRKFLLLLLGWKPLCGPIESWEKRVREQQ